MFKLRILSKSPHHSFWQVNTCNFNLLSFCVIFVLVCFIIQISMHLNLMIFRHRTMLQKGEFWLYFSTKLQIYFIIYFCSLSVQVLFFKTSKILNRCQHWQYCNQWICPKLNWPSNIFNMEFWTRIYFAGSLYFQVFPQKNHFFSNT